MSDFEYSNYVKYLPAIYHKGLNQTDSEYLIGRFLKAFEQILSGTTEVKKDSSVGIEKMLDRISQYFDPAYTPASFVPWLASWVGIEAKDGLEFYGKEDYAQKDITSSQTLPLDDKRTSINRNMIENMVQLYKKRGTLQGMMEYLQIYAGDEVNIVINEYENLTKIGSEERIGFNTITGNANACFFSVSAVIPAYKRSVLDKKVRLIREVIEKEKPFYTNYTLNVEVPAMRVGVYSKVGRETLLGGMLED